CQVGIVTADGKVPRWPDVPGDPREYYITFMEWAGNSQEVVIQQLNRLQNTVRIMRVTSRLDGIEGERGEVRTILTEHDEAWLDLQDELRWVHDGKEFLWLSERDGWRHVYRVDRSGNGVTLVTPGEFDVIEVLAV